MLLERVTPVVQFLEPLVLSQVMLLERVTQVVQFLEPLVPLVVHFQVVVSLQRVHK